MVEAIPRNPALILNAAGPRLQLALLREGEVVERSFSDKPALESLVPGVRELLARHALPLSALEGVLFAKGPGSSLALRLATMTLRAWVRLPTLQHWKLAMFQNLEVCAVPMLCEPRSTETTVYAPYRRDRLHRCRATRTGEGFRFSTDTAGVEEANEAGGLLFRIGNRMAPDGLRLEERNPPLAEIPGLLMKFPSLLETCREVAPLQVSEAEPVRWSQRRHEAR
ncbi:MAG: hypothetical protein GVY10_08300 [Verrucomicrobia bacterium]|jgi:hypothetical protein|nr:hypothetical protein [Verrucomicrobiota bacterium]